MEFLKENIFYNKEILLHICCAPCATWSIQQLKDFGYENIVLFYSNSNIYPKDEYEKRLIYVKKLAEKHSLSLIIDEYNHKDWLSCCRPYATEPEGGKRCSLCFEYNLKRASQIAQKLSIKEFTTTLTISPYKKSEMIFKEGSKFPGYIPFNFKKKDGYRKSIELSKKENYYRQCYCGCEYSLIEMRKRKIKKG